MLHKISKRQNPKISKRQDREEIVADFRKRVKTDPKAKKQLILQMKEWVKQDPTIIKTFKEYGVSLDEIDKSSVTFAPLDVSAKTKDLKIYLNESMLDEDSDVKDPTEYISHEMSHLAQQLTGKTKGHETKRYLDKQTEEIAFKNQIEYKKRNEGDEEAEKYVDDLLTYHD